MGTDNAPDILGLCETFLDQAVNDEQLCINGFDFFSKRHTKRKINQVVVLFSIIENHGR